jgi:hypothetical protein
MKAVCELLKMRREKEKCATYNICAIGSTRRERKSQYKKFLHSIPLETAIIEIYNRFRHKLIGNLI